MLKPKDILPLPAGVIETRDMIAAVERDRMAAWGDIEIPLPKSDPKRASKILASDPLDYHPAKVGSPEWKKPGTRFVPKSAGSTKVRFSVN